MATCGLVLMFQSLTKKYSQPIACFASKKNVPGQELAKIVLRAICLLENAGAFVHGIIGDGASSNRKMWKILGIATSQDDLKTSFAHRLDEKRQIFMFSDTPHLIKCIRNALYKKSELMVIKNDVVKWKYFRHLYDADFHLGNARVCPRISRRHIEPDSTSKMRVKYVTQIFSKSVANGLSFYLSHKYCEFKGCEPTVAFCLRMNNMFDALNRKQADEGLTPDSDDFKILEDTLTWLNKWEYRTFTEKSIDARHFLTKTTAHGLRVTVRSTLDLCEYLIKNFNFKYLLTRRVNQDNLEVILKKISCEYAGVKLISFIFSNIQFLVIYQFLARAVEASVYLHPLTPRLAGTKVKLLNGVGSIACH